MMAAREAKEASELSTQEPTAQDAAASLAKSTGGAGDSRPSKTTSFDGHPELSDGDAA